MAQLPPCTNNALDEIKFNVSTEFEVEVAETGLHLYLRVSWTVDNPQNATLDGFAVHFMDEEMKRNLNDPRSIHPDSGCNSGEDHLWVITDDVSACDRSRTLSQCTEEIPSDACLCPKSNCTSLFPLNCQSFVELLRPHDEDYFVTVLPATRSVRIPSGVGKEYVFVITPYYRGFANLEPDITLIPAVTECDPRILIQLGEVAVGSSCIFANWTTTAQYDNFTVEISIPGMNVTTVAVYHTSATSINMCGLELCQRYFVKIFEGDTMENLLTVEYHVIYPDFQPTGMETKTPTVESTTTTLTPTPPTSTLSTTSTFPTTNSTTTPTTTTVTSDGCHTITCDEFATCVLLTEDNPTCFCDAGFMGSGSTCHDIDECDSMSNNCDHLAICTNAEGTFTCTCPDGYTGDGTACTALDCSHQWLSGFTFPATQPGLVSYSEEKCEGIASSRASVRCVVSSTLESPWFDTSTLVRINCSETIDDITSQRNLTSEQVSQSLQHLQVLTSDVGRLVQDDVTQITVYFEGLAPLQQFSSQDVKNVAEISSHLSEYYSQSKTEDPTDSLKQSLVKSLTAISRRLDVTTDSFEALSQGIIVEVRDVSNPSSATSVTFSPNFYTDFTSTSTFSPIEIKIPGEAFLKAEARLTQRGATGRQSSSVRAVSVGYRNNSLFPSSRQTDWIVASSLGNKDTTLDDISLSEPVVIVNKEITDQPRKRERDQFKTDLTNLECVYWDFNKGAWSREGCCLVPETPPECHCDHLTNFAILVSKEEIPSNIALSIVTYIGCGLSIICLLCTVLVISLVKRLRRKHPMQVVANISICLAISFMFFIFGVDSGANEAGCSVIAVFLHYFLLATWFWMAVFSHTVYRDVVKVLESYGQKYNMVAAAVVSYGIPLVVVALNAGIALGHIDRNQQTYACDGNDLFIDSSYNSRNYCWLQKNSLYFGFLLLIGILLVFNIVIYCITIPRITCRKQQVQSSASPNSIKHNIIISLVMATTMGLSWIIGYFMLVADNQSYLTVMSWIFAIVNSFQGVFIFLLTVVRTGEVKKLFNSRLVSFGTERNKTSSTSSTGLGGSPLPSPAPRV